MDPLIQVIPVVITGHRRGIKIIRRSAKDRDQYLIPRFWLQHHIFREYTVTYRESPIILYIQRVILDYLQPLKPKYEHILLEKPSFFFKFFLLALHILFKWFILFKISEYSLKYDVGHPVEHLWDTCGTPCGTYTCGTPCGTPVGHLWDTCGTPCETYTCGTPCGIPVGHPRRYFWSKEKALNTMYTVSHESWQLVYGLKCLLSLFDKLFDTKETNNIFHMTVIL